ncbi:MAG TPA: PCRF domain-containing protein, partial [Flavitalea sp.]|nr:PCRF domain-containing protein [Flavitalea sp.]
MNQEKQLSVSPGFWDDNKRATEILKNIQLNEYWVKLYESVESAVDDFSVLFDFWKEGEAAEEEVREANEKAIRFIEEAEFKSTLNQPEDELPAILQINSGAGGTESQDWAEILMRMYRMYGDKQDWSVTQLDLQDG